MLQNSHCSAVDPAVLRHPDTCQNEHKVPLGWEPILPAPLLPKRNKVQLLTKVSAVSAPCPSVLTHHQLRLQPQQQLSSAVVPLNPTGTHKTHWAATGSAEQSYHPPESKLAAYTYLPSRESPFKE